MGSDHNLMLRKFDFNKSCQGGSKQEPDKRRKVKKAAKTGDGTERNKQIGQATEQR